MSEPDDFLISTYYWERAKNLMKSYRTSHTSNLDKEFIEDVLKFLHQLDLAFTHKREEWKEQTFHLHYGCNRPLKVFTNPHDLGYLRGIDYADAEARVAVIFGTNQGGFTYEVEAQDSQCESSASEKDT